MSEFVRGLKDKETELQYKGNAFLRLLGYLRPYIKTVLICFLLVSILTALDLIRPMLIGDAIDKYILTMEEGQLTDSSLTQAEIEAATALTPDAYKLTEGKEGVKYTPYTVSGFLSAPAFEVKDAEGNAVELVYDEQSGVSRVGAGSITVLLPEGYTAYIGDVAITEQFKTADEAEASVFNAFLREGVPGVNYVKYVVEGFIDLPEIKVKNAQGAESIVTYDAQSVTFEALPVYDAQLRADNEAWILEAFETITLYLQNVAGTKAGMRAYFDTTSEAWKGYNSINPNWNFEALSYTFEDKSVTEFISYDADHFSCRVKLHYIGRRGSKGLYEETTDKIVFFRRSGGKFLIYNVSNTEALSGLGVEN